jgi:hypothetical protein
MHDIFIRIERLLKHQNIDGDEVGTLFALNPPSLSGVPKMAGDKLSLHIIINEEIGE